MHISLQKANRNAFEQIKKLLSFIPWNNSKKADPFPKKNPKSKLYDIDKIFPTDAKQPYDVVSIIRAIADDSRLSLKYINILHLISLSDLAE